MNNLLQGSALSVEMSEVGRLMGYPSSDLMSMPVREICQQQLARLDTLCVPWGAWRDFELRSVHANGIELDGGLRLTSRRLAKLLRGAQTMRLFLVTLGEAVSVEVQRLVHDSCMLEALALDAAATTAVHALTEELIRRTCEEAQRHGRGTTIRYAPGYTGWQIDDISILLASLACEQPPIRLNDQLMMQPGKSLLSIVGLTDDGHIAAPLEQCRGCALIHCSARRAPYRSPRPSRGAAHSSSSH